MKSSRKSSASSPHSWQLQEAKAQFSEVVRRAQTRPQRVTVRGKDSVVVLSVAEYERRMPASTKSLDELMASSPLAEIDLASSGSPMPVREVSL